MHRVSRPYLIPQYHSCNILVFKIYKNGNTKRKTYDFFQFYVTKYSIHHSLSAETGFNFRALIVFEILHLQKFIRCFLKGPIATRGDNSEKYVSGILP